jgi:hypothetical protein
MEEEKSAPRPQGGATLPLPLQALKIIFLNPCREPLQGFFMPLAYGLRQMSHVQTAFGRIE